jgi:hypothetical protein
MAADGDNDEGGWKHPLLIAGVELLGAVVGIVGSVAGARVSADAENDRSKQTLLVSTYSEWLADLYEYDTAIETLVNELKQPEDFGELLPLADVERAWKDPRGQPVRAECGHYTACRE